MNTKETMKSFQSLMGSLHGTSTSNNTRNERTDEVRMEDEGDAVHVGAECGDDDDDRSFQDDSSAHNDAKESVNDTRGQTKDNKKDTTEQSTSMDRDLDSPRSSMVDSLEEIPKSPSLPTPPLPLSIGERRTPTSIRTLIGDLGSDKKKDRDRNSPHRSIHIRKAASSSPGQRVPTSAPRNLSRRDTRSRLAFQKSKSVGNLTSGLSMDDDDEEEEDKKRNSNRDYRVTALTPSSSRASLGSSSGREGRQSARSAQLLQKSKSLRHLGGGGCGGPSLYSTTNTKAAAVAPATIRRRRGRFDRSQSMSKLLLTDKADESEEEHEQDKPSMAPAEAPKVISRRLTRAGANVSTLPASRGSSRRDGLRRVKSVSGLAVTSSSKDDADHRKKLSGTPEQKDAGRVATSSKSPSRSKGGSRRAGLKKAMSVAGLGLSESGDSGGSGGNISDRQGKLSGKPERNSGRAPAMASSKSPSRSRGSSGSRRSELRKAKSVSGFGVFKSNDSDSSGRNDADCRHGKLVGKPEQEADMARTETLPKSPSRSRGNSRSRRLGLRKAKSVSGLGVFKSDDSDSSGSKTGKLETGEENEDQRMSTNDGRSSSNRMMRSKSATRTNACTKSTAAASSPTSGANVADSTNTNSIPCHPRSQAQSTRKQGKKVDSGKDRSLKGLKDLRNKFGAGRAKASEVCNHSVTSDSGSISSISMSSRLNGTLDDFSVNSSHRSFMRRSYSSPRLFCDGDFNSSLREAEDESTVDTPTKRALCRWESDPSSGSAAAPVIPDHSSICGELMLSPVAENAGRWSSSKPCISLENKMAADSIPVPPRHEVSSHSRICAHSWQDDYMHAPNTPSFSVQTGVISELTPATCASSSLPRNNRTCTQGSNEEFCSWMTSLHSLLLQDDDASSSQKKDTPPKMIRRHSCDSIISQGLNSSVSRLSSCPEDREGLNLPVVSSEQSSAFIEEAADNDNAPRKPSRRTSNCSSSFHMN